MRIKEISVLFLLIIGCTSPKYLAEPRETANIILAVEKRPAQLLLQPVGLEDYVVIGEENLSLFLKNPKYITERARLMGAQKALLLNTDSVHERQTVKRYCWGCLVLDVAIATAGAYSSGSINQLPSFNYGYTEEVSMRSYRYHVIYLIHPDSIVLPDKIRAVEFYDKNDEYLISTAYFNWNEQLESIEGNPVVAQAWLNTQPLGFMLQRDGSWMSGYNESSNSLNRYNTKNGYRYRIKPMTNDGYTVEMKTKKKNIKLATLYYGQHDWTVANKSKLALLQIDYDLDDKGRMHYMKVVDSLDDAPLRYHVRIYYRDNNEKFPESWRWRSYKPQFM